jgi:outer membrane protein
MKKAILAIVLVGWSVNAFAEAGDWLFRIGGSLVAPKSDNLKIRALDNTKVEVDDGYSLTFNGAYFLTNRWAIEVLAAAPFKHDIDVGGDEIAETKHLPPTVSAQYHFIPNGKVRPYIGLGVNYTFLFEESIDGGAELELDNSVGLAAQVGIDFEVADNMFINVDVRYIDIESDAELKLPDGGGKLDLGTVEIDPIVAGLHLGWRF